MNRPLINLSALDTNTIKLVDLYSGNERDTMAQLAAQGFTGVIFKLGQGGWSDVPRYKPNWWKEAGDAGLLRGGYWLCDSRHHSSYHMDEIRRWNILRDYSGELGFWVDIEKPVISMTETDYRKTPYAGSKNLVDFIYLLKLDGFKPGAYTGPGAYNLVMENASVTDHVYLAELPLWTAQYPYVYIPGVSKPSLYGKWLTWEFWQWRAEPDINIFNGTDEQFRAKYGGVIQPPEENKMIYTALFDSLRIRTGPAVTFPQVTTAPIVMNKSQTATVIALFGTEGSEQWAQIGDERWINVWHNGAKNGTLTGELPPPPPPPAGHTVDVEVDGVNVYHADLK